MNSHESLLVRLGHLPAGHQSGPRAVSVRVGAARKDPRRTRRHERACLGARRAARRHSQSAAVVGADLGRCLGSSVWSIFVRYPGFGDFQGTLGWTSAEQLQRDTESNNAKLEARLQPLRSLSLGAVGRGSGCSCDRPSPVPRQLRRVSRRRRTRQSGSRRAGSDGCRVAVWRRQRQRDDQHSRRAQRRHAAARRRAGSARRE